MLDIIRDEELQQRALEVGAHAKRLLEGVMARHPKHVGDVRGLGLFLGVEIVEDAVRHRVWCGRCACKKAFVKSKEMTPSFLLGWAGGADAC